MRGGEQRPARRQHHLRRRLRRQLPEGHSLLVKERIPCTYFVTVRNVLEGEPFAHDLAGGNRLPPNTLEQLRAMAAAGIEIGAHSYTHRRPRHDRRPQRLRREVVAAGEELRAALGRPVRYFAFPFGLHANLNAAAFALAARPAMRASARPMAASTSPATTLSTCSGSPGDDMIRLKNWPTVDPCKMNTPRFAYDCRPPQIENTPVQL